MPKMRKMRVRRLDFSEFGVWINTIKSPLHPLAIPKEERKGKASRRNVVSFLLLSLLGLVLCIICYSTYFPSRMDWVSFATAINYSSHGVKSREIRDGGGSRGCSFPRLEPFAPEIRPFINDPPYIDCLANYPLRFRTNFRNQLIPVHQGTKNEVCCYKTVKRGKGSDSNLKYSKPCYPVSQTKPTEIPASHEFIIVRCTKLIKTNGTTGKLSPVETHKDIFTFVHLKPEVEARVQRIDKLRQPKTASADNRLNILMLGMDAQSHMNFLRQMTKTHDFLVQNLSAVGLQGYTKVGDNTFPNLIPLLTGFSEEGLKEECWPSKSSYFDRCPFIWKHFENAGYRTSFAEDAVWMGMFTYDKKGFEWPPTDYYMHPITGLMSKKIGHNNLGNAKLCYGPRLAFEVLLDFIVKTAVNFENKRYFQFVWSNSLFHDYLNNPKLGDEILYLTLEYLSRNGYLDNTLLILLSDHGLRWGAIRSTYQGRLEERMPLAYFAFPAGFRKIYEPEFQTLQQNAVSKLTSPFDIHATLAHVLEIGTGTKINTSKLGRSLLKEIPNGRLCHSAGIQNHWCVCFKFHPVPITSPLVRSAASFAVTYINHLLHSRREYCAKLSLKSAINAAKRVRDEDETTQMDMTPTDAPQSQMNTTQRNHTETIQLQITLEVNPSSAIFEVTLTKQTDDEEWIISGDISRLNVYRQESHCIKDFALQKYCYCKDLMNRKTLLEIS